MLFFALVFKSYSLIVFSVFIFSFLVIGALSLPKPAIKSSRTISKERIFEDGEVEVAVSVAGKGLIEIKDVLPKVFKINKGSNGSTFFLSPDKTETIRYTIECPLKGVYFLGPLCIRYEDPFGLFYTEKEFPTVTEIIVFPKIEDIKDFPLHATVPRMYPGAIPVKYPGIGTEFYSMRDYVSGDSFRDINWKVYSRLHKLVVTQRQMETTSDVAIVLDARAVTATGYVNSNALLYSIRVVASLAAFFLRLRCNVSLTIYNDTIKTISPGYGERHLYKILRTLADVEGKGNVKFQAVGKTFSSSLAPRSSIILVSSLEEDDTLITGAKELCDRGFDFIILSPSSLTMERKISPSILETLMLEREVLTLTLRSSGTRVIDWNPIETQISQALGVIESKR